MPSYAAAGLGQALGQAAPQFTQALARIGQMRRQRKLDREERDRYHDKIARDRTKMRLEAVQTPGVSVGEPEGPMTSAMQRIGAVGDTPLYYQEPEPEPATFTYRGAELPLSEQGVATATSLRRHLEPPEAGGGVTLRGQESPYDPVRQPEKYRQWVQGVEGPIQDVRRGPEHEERPTFGQAMENIINPEFQTGTEWSGYEEVPTYSLSPSERAAKADSLATGKLGVAEFAERHKTPRGGGQSETDRQRRVAGGAPGFKDEAEGQTDTDSNKGPPDLPDVEATELKRLVRASRNSGAEDQSIRQNLKRAGYTESQIEWAMESAED